ncbi:MAG: YggS family pyridoxal phosphate-dependent enzyme [Magnetococcales bacterium]|nr:YggS family pyridoxal phosphate-dependent enzyme [Magnetococcales bacterium]
MNSTIVSNLEWLQDRIRQAARAGGRDPAQVRLVAVSKTQPAAAVNAAVAAGQTLFGENRVQEARYKIPQVTGSSVDWHLIGPLQRNKVKVAVELFQMIHSVDSVALAEDINRRVPGPDPLPVLLQINVGREPQKHGLLPEETAAALEAIAPLSRIAVKGLMTIPPFEPDPEMVRPHFRALADLAQRLERLNLPGVSMAELSMGMSHDFEAAVAEGATLVRIGTALFGERSTRP